MGIRNQLFLLLFIRIVCAFIFLLCKFFPTLSTMNSALNCDQLLPDDVVTQDMADTV